MLGVPGTLGMRRVRARQTYPLYNHRGANERVLAAILGPSQRPSENLHIQYEVNGKAVIHYAAALHHPEFHIRSPSPSGTCWSGHPLGT